jgi:phytol kinase
MIAILLAVLPVFLLLVFTEYLWRHNKLRGESARKFVHILVGSYVAFWPFFISFEAIQLISAAFLLVVAVSLKFNVFKSIHGVARQTWGEVLFAVGIGLVAVLTNEPWVFAACILHLSVADGLAALTGLAWGKKTMYVIAGHKKSLVGTGVFWFSSLIITAIAIYHLPYLQLESRSLLLWLPLATSFTENLGLGGTDNVLVPLIVYLGLTAY